MCRLFETSEVDKAGALMQVAELIVVYHLGIALVERKGLLVVFKIIETIGFGEHAVGIVGIDGYRIFAAGDCRVVVFVHELCTCQRNPITGGVGVVIDELVEDTLAVLVFSQSEEGAGHQLLEVVGVITL